MIIVVYICMVFIGLVLGLIGGGGTLLAMPALVYLKDMNVVEASSYSMALVGITAWSSTLQNALKQRVDYLSGISFALPSVLTVLLVRTIVVPHLPHVFFYVGDYIVYRDQFLMSLFALMVFFAALSMLQKSSHLKAKMEPVSALRPAMVLAGMGEGFITGLVGAGGGFLIIPALVFLGHIPFHMAIGTSLFIIALKSTVGFGADLWKHNSSWSEFLLYAAAFTVLGSFVGSYFSSRVADNKLKKIFAWFTIAMAIVIVVKEWIIK